MMEAHHTPQRVLLVMSQPATIHSSYRRRYGDRSTPAAAVPVVAASAGHSQLAVQSPVRCALRLAAAARENRHF